MLLDSGQCSCSSFTAVALVVFLVFIGLDIGGTVAALLFLLILLIGGIAPRLGAARRVGPRACRQALMPGHIRSDVFVHTFAP